MAESPGTRVKLGHQEWQHIPPSVRDQAYKHGMTWNAAVDMTRCLSTEEPDDNIVMILGQYMSNLAQLKLKAEKEGSFVELTPRSAVTERVPAIKLTDGRYVPVGNKSVPPPPPPPVHTGNGEGDMSPPPGNFKNKDEMEAPPGQFGKASSSTTPQPHINHGVSLLPSNHAEKEEEESRTPKSTPGVNTWWDTEDIK